MSITIGTEPAALVTGYNDIEFKVTSSRNQQTEHNVTTISSSSGFAKYQVTGDPTSTVAVGDVITPDVSVDGYNVPQTVTAVSTGPGLITTNATYTSGSSGTLTVSNDNFKVKATVCSKDSDYTATTLTATGAADGTTFVCALVSSDSWTVGDWVYHVGFSGAYANANGLKQITSITAATNTYKVGTAAYSVGSQAAEAITMDVLGVMYAQSSSVLAASTFDFNIKSLLQTDLSGALVSLASANIQTTTGDTAMTLYAVNFDEIFEDEDGVYKTGSSKVSDGKQVTNGVNQAWETQTTDRFDLDGTSKEFLTNAPNTLQVHINQELQVSFMTQFSAVRLGYNKYNLAGTEAGWTNLGNVTLQDDSETYLRGVIPFSTDSIMDTSTSRIDYRIEKTDGTVISETKTIYIDQTTYDTPVVLEFKNPYGGWDSYTYVAKVSGTVNIDRVGSKNDVTISTSWVKSQRELTLDSRYDNKDTMEWLEDLYQSREIYMIDSRYSDGRVKVNLTESNYLLLGEDLFSSQIKIQLQEKLVN
jgi:hypothetical protein